MPLNGIINHSPLSSFSLLLVLCSVGTFALHLAPHHGVPASPQGHYQHSQVSADGARTQNKQFLLSVGFLGYFVRNRQPDRHTSSKRLHYPLLRICKRASDDGTRIILESISNRKRKKPQN